MSKIKAIKCPNCAAPLDLLGGGRVNSIVCSYCKSIIDLNRDYKIVGTFKHIKAQHELPFEIGMKGVIKGVEWTIIGRVDYITQEFPFEEWSDLLLFSPLYGYAWLTYENGHLVYSKRVRDFPLVSWRELSSFETIEYNDIQYKYEDDYLAKVIYVEGELTWIAKLDDVAKYIDFVSPPYGISAEKSANEVEYYLSEYLNADDVYKAFDAQKEEEPEGDNPLKPFDKPFFRELSNIAFIFLFIVIAAYVEFRFDGQGREIKSFTVTNKKQVVSDFNVTSNKYLVDIILNASNANSLNNFKIDVLKDKKDFFRFDKSYAYKSDIGKLSSSWDKGAYRVSALINIDKLGKYTIKVTPRNKNLNSKVEVKILEERVRLNYLFYFAIFTFIAWIWYKILYLKNRISGIFSSDAIWIIIIFFVIFLIAIFT